MDVIGKRTARLSMNQIHFRLLSGRRYRAPAPPTNSRYAHDPTHALIRGLAKESALTLQRMRRDKEYYDQEIVTLGSQSDFKLRTLRGCRYATLSRRLHEERIEVRFQWDFVKSIAWQPNRFQIRRKVFPLGYGSYAFNVRIHIPSRGVLSVDCLTLMGDALTIQDFQFQSSSHSKGQEAYTGRHYQKLSPVIQKALLGYLSSRGVDDKLCKYIVAISDQRGFEEDLLWTTRLRDFLAEP